MKTYSEYRKEKSKQRKGYTTKNDLKKEKETKQRDVVISIGLMDWREKDVKLMAKRGKKISLRVSNMATKTEIRILAENKWKQFHPDFYNDRSFYTLLYESANEVDTLPGSYEAFTLHRYQQETGKDFKRIIFYLCNENDLAIKKRIAEIYVDENSFESDSYDNTELEAPEEKRLKVWRDT